MKTAYLRFYEELNDLLPKDKRKKRFEHKFFGNPSVKDVIESLGVPHGEVDMILVNGNSVNFSYTLRDGDDISVYPEFESMDISNVQYLRERPLRVPKFVLDVHLGTLARYLRMLGFDSLYKNNYSDDEIINLSLNEKRTILTKDKGILKRKEITHGCYVRSIYPVVQLKEIAERFDLYKSFKEFSRCMECNTLLKPVDKNKISGRLPPKVKEFQNEFYICESCNKIYWPGSHYKKMKKIINNLTGHKK